MGIETKTENIIKNIKKMMIRKNHLLNLGNYASGSMIIHAKKDGQNQNNPFSFVALFTRVLKFEGCFSSGALRSSGLGVTG